jgi:phosphomannomutase
MWIIKQFNDPGPDYGMYQVGYNEQFGNEGHIFRGIGSKYQDTPDGILAAMNVCSYLNGGMSRGTVSRLEIALNEIPQALDGIRIEIKKMQRP